MLDYPNNVAKAQLKTLEPFKSGFVVKMGWGGIMGHGFSWDWVIRRLVG